MKHYFFGGPLDGLSADLDVFLADNDLTLSVPWEDYACIATALDDDGKPTVKQWKYRGEDVDIPSPNATSVREHRPMQGPDGFSVVTAVMQWNAERVGARPALIVKDMSELSDDQLAQLDAINSRFDVSIAPKLASYEPEMPADESEVDAQVFDQSVQESAQESNFYNSGVNIWDTFESRRKALKLPRGKFGEECGLTSSFGWRLESGNVSNRDAKKLGLDSIEAVYLMADGVLRRLESGS